MNKNIAYIGSVPMSEIGEIFIKVNSKTKKGRDYIFNVKKKRSK